MRWSYSRILLPSLDSIKLYIANLDIYLKYALYSALGFFMLFVILAMYVNSYDISPSVIHYYRTLSLVSLIVAILLCIFVLVVSTYHYGVTNLRILHLIALLPHIIYIFYQIHDLVKPGNTDMSFVTATSLMMIFTVIITLVMAGGWLVEKK